MSSYAQSIFMYAFIKYMFLSTKMHLENKKNLAKELFLHFTSTFIGVWIGPVV